MRTRLTCSCSGVRAWLLGSGGRRGRDGVGGRVTGCKVLSGATGLSDRVIVAVAGAVGGLLLKLSGRRGHGHGGCGGVVSVRSLSQVLHGGLAIEVRVTYGASEYQLLIPQ